MHPHTVTKFRGMPLLAPPGEKPDIKKTIKVKKIIRKNPCSEKCPCQFLLYTGDGLRQRELHGLDCRVGILRKGAHKQR